MKYIQKTTCEPSLFIAWKIDHATTINTLNNNATVLWDYFGKNHGGVKIDLKEQLCQDQGFICCYCMQRICNDDQTVIEHLEAKSNDPLNLTFDFSNLLASCHGEARTPKPKVMHCDGSKGPDSIAIHPLMPDCETFFKFTSEGEIIGDNTPATDTINLLGLDVQKLKLLRKSAIDDELANTATRDAAIKRVNELTQKQSSHFTPFCVALIYILKDEFGIS